MTVLRLSNFAYFAVAFALFFVAIAGRALIDPAHTYLTPLAGSADCDKRIVDRSGVIMTVLGCSPEPLNLTRSDDDVIAAYGDMDAGSYLKGAHLLMTGNDTRDNYIFRLWPPGMMYMEAGLIRLAGPVHFVMAMFVMTSLAWSLSLAYCAIVLRLLSRNDVFPVALFGVFALLLFRLYFFRTGIAWSESFSTAIFLSAALAIGYGMGRRNWLSIITGACLLTIATFMRSQYLIIAQCFFCLALAAGVACTILRFRLRSLPAFFWPGAIAAILVYAAPIVAYSQWNHGQFVYNDYFYGKLFNTPRATSTAPEDRGTSFLDIGGGRAVCDIDPANCTIQQAKDPSKTPASVFRSNAVKVILLHPAAFMRYKLPYIVKFFFAEPGYLSQGIYAFDYAENAFFLICAVLAMALGVRLYRLPFAWVTVAMLVATWFGCVAPAAFLHVEARYLFMAKAESLFAALAMMAAWLGQRPPVTMPAWFRSRTTTSG